MIRSKILFIIIIPIRRNLVLSHHVPQVLLGPVVAVALVRQAEK